MSEDSDKIKLVREKFVEGFINMCIAGFLFLAGFGVLEAYLADSKRDKMREEFTKQLTDEHNASVKREGEVLEKIAKIEQENRKQTERLDKLPSFFEGPTIPLPIMPRLPDLNPAQQRLDWQTKHEKTYNQFNVKKE